jgi:hypothetical protein
MPEEGFLMVQFRQSHRVLRQDVSVRQDVMQRGSPFAEDLPDQEPPMALLGSATAAQQSQPTVLSTLQQAIDCFLERCLPCHLGVQRMAFSVVVVLALGPTAKRNAEKDVRQAMCLDGRLEALAVEMRRNPRVGVRADIDDVLDDFASDKRDEVLEVVVGMPDSPHRESRRHAC